MEQIKVLSAAIKKRTGAPAAQAVVQGKGITEQTAEVYPLPGLFVVPPNGAKLLLIPLEAGKTRVAVGGVNYQVSISQEQGGTTLYSTTADGKTVKALIALSPKGLISIKNEQQSIETLLEELIDDISNLTTYGSPASHSVTAASQTKLTQLKAKLQQILEA